MPQSREALALSYRMRAVAVVAVLALLAAACGDDGANPIFATNGSPDTATSAPLPSDAEGIVVPEPSTLIIDEDPYSPVAATVTFEDGDHPIDRVDYLGPKPSSNLPPTTALVYLRDSDEVLQIDFDAAGRPAAMGLGEVGELRFGFDGSTMIIEYVAPDGSTSSESFALAEGGNGPQSTGASSAGEPVNAVRAAYRDAVVDVNRAVFVHVSIVSSPEAPLPNYFSAPFLRIDGCHSSQSRANFECSRVAGQLLQSYDTLREYRLAMTHRANASLPGVDPSIWPSAQACQEALGNDWWVNSPLGVTLEVSAATLAKQLFTFLATNPEAAAAGVAASEAFLPSVAIATFVVAGFTFGNWVGEQVFEGGEGNCDTIKRRVDAMNILGALVEDAAFTIQVCVPPTEGWTLDHECQDIGPYQPFSGALATVVGDPGTLDRNQLPPVEFYATPEPGAVAGTVIDADTSEPIAGATVSVIPSGPSTATDAVGQFAFAEVPAGVQTISVTAAGFDETTAQVEVEVGETAEVAIAVERLGPEEAVLGVWSLSAIWKTGGGWADGTMTFTAGGGMTFGYAEAWGGGAEFIRSGSGVWSITGDVLTVSWPVLAGEIAYDGVYAGSFDARSPIILLLSDDWNFTLTR